MYPSNTFVLLQELIRGVHHSGDHSDRACLIVLGTGISPPDVVVIVLVNGTAFIAFTYFTKERTRSHLDAAIAAPTSNR